MPDSGRAASNANPKSAAASEPRSGACLSPSDDDDQLPFKPVHLLGVGAAVLLSGFMFGSWFGIKRGESFVRDKVVSDSDNSFERMKDEYLRANKLHQGPPPLSAQEGGLYDPQQPHPTGALAVANSSAIGAGGNAQKLLIAPNIVASAGKALLGVTLGWAVVACVAIYGVKSWLGVQNTKEFNNWANRKWGKPPEAQTKEQLAQEEAKLNEIWHELKTSWSTGAPAPGKSQT